MRLIRGVSPGCTKLGVRAIVAQTERRNPEYLDFRGLTPNWQEASGFLSLGRKEQVLGMYSIIHFKVDLGAFDHAQVGTYTTYAWGLSR